MDQKVSSQHNEILYGVCPENKKLIWYQKDAKVILILQNYVCHTLQIASELVSFIFMTNLNDLGWTHNFFLDQGKTAFIFFIHALYLGKIDNCWQFPWGVTSWPGLSALQMCSVVCWLITNEPLCQCGLFTGLMLVGNVTV